MNEEICNAWANMLLNDTPNAASPVLAYLLGSGDSYSFFKGLMILMNCFFICLVFVFTGQVMDKNMRLEEERLKGGELCAYANSRERCIKTKVSRPKDALKPNQTEKCLFNWDDDCTFPRLFLYPLHRLCSFLHNFYALWQRIVSRHGKSQPENQETSCLFSRKCFHSNGTVEGMHKRLQHLENLYTDTWPIRVWGNLHSSTKMSCIAIHMAVSLVTWQHISQLPS